MDNYNRVIYTSPYDSEVEYLESTGTQYLNLGRIPWDKEILFETQTAYTRKYGVGREGSSNALYMGYNENRYETAWMTYYGTLDDNYHIISKKLSYKYNPQKLFSYIDGVEVFRYDMVIEKDSAYAYDLLVFAICGLDGPGFYMHCKKKSFKVIVDGVTVHDLIPVRKGNIGYMYDKVSGKLFGNAGTGNFILGNDVPNPIPKIRNVVYTRPYDRRVEYLESTGTQWINTGVIPTRTTHTQVYKSFTRSDQNLGGDGIYNERNIRFHDGIYEGKFHFGIGNSQNWVNTIIADTNKHLFELFGSGYAKLDGTTYNISNGNDTYNWEFALFRRIGANEFTGEQIVYCKIYQEDTLVRDFIPVRRGTKGYMYDKVSGRLFGNAGTGNFILGNDVVKPNVRRVIPMPYDSKIEYLESPIGNAYINTLIPTNEISEFTVRIAPTTVPSTFYALGADSGGDTRFSIGYSSSGAGYVQIRLGEYYNVIRYALERFDTITLNRLTGKYYVNGTKYTGKIVTNSKTNPNSFILFRARNSGTALNTSKNTTRIASFSAKGSNGELLIDLIPVRKNGIGYMYDRVSGKLFGNVGTGQFILGNDIN